MLLQNTKRKDDEVQGDHSGPITAQVDEQCRLSTDKDRLPERTSGSAPNSGLVFHYYIGFFKIFFQV